MARYTETLYEILNWGDIVAANENYRLIVVWDRSGRLHVYAEAGDGFALVETGVLSAPTFPKAKTTGKEWLRKIGAYAKRRNIKL